MWRSRCLLEENMCLLLLGKFIERCVKDLKERFAKVNLEVSPPLVSYKDTIEGDGSNLLESLKSTSSDFVEKRTPNGRCVIRVHVMKLPHALTKLLDENTELLGDIIGGKGSHTVKPSLEENVDPIEALKKQLIEAGVSSIPGTEKDREKCKSDWGKLLKRIWALGPREKGPNILFAPDGKRLAEDGSILVRGSPHVSQRLGFFTEEDITETCCSEEEALYSEARSLESSIVSGFQLATASGPLCDEPMWGLAFTIESHLAGDSETEKQPENFGIFTGQVITVVKDA